MDPLLPALVPVSHGDVPDIGAVTAHRMLDIVIPGIIIFHVHPDVQPVRRTIRGIVDAPGLGSIPAAGSLVRGPDEIDRHHVTGSQGDLPGEFFKDPGFPWIDDVNIGVEGH